jgi:hypothetical protein
MVMVMHKFSLNLSSKREREEKETGKIIEQ